MSQLVLSFACVRLTLAGCGRSGDPDGAEKKSDKPRSALVMKSLATIFFTMAEAARVHQAENGERYELIFGSIKDERDLSRQVALIEGMVAAGDAIVIAPADSKALVPVLRRAVRQGVVVVNISNRFDAEVLAAGGVTIPFVGPDSRTGSFRLRSCLPLIPTRLAASHWRRSAAPG